MSWVYLSYPLSESTPGYRGQQGFCRTNTKSMSRGDSCNQQEWELSNHIGTHIDVPRHFSSSGQSVECYPADFWICQKVQLIDRTTNSAELIDIRPHLEKISKDTELLLLRTGFESFRAEERYWEQGPGLDEQAGFLLRENRPSLRFVGFDFLSLTSFQHREAGRKAHQSFLNPDNHGSPINIIEDMSLGHLRANPLEVIISPLRVEGADGSPVTVLARVD